MAFAEEDMLLASSSDGRVRVRNAQIMHNLSTEPGADLPVR